MDQMIRRPAFCILYSGCSWFKYGILAFFFLFHVIICHNDRFLCKKDYRSHICYDHYSKPGIVAETGNFSKAAKQLHMTPSAVSHAIASFEEELGFPLFKRSRGTKMYMTEDGKVILGYVQKILKYEQYLNEAASQICGFERGTITIGAFTSICIAWIPTIIASFNKRFPDIVINIVEGDYSQIASWLREGSIDIGFQTGSEKDIETEMIHRDRFMCLLPPDFKTKRKDCVDIRELDHSRLIFQRQGYDADMQGLMKKIDLKVTPKFFRMNTGTLV